MKAYALNFLLPLLLLAPACKNHAPPRPNPPPGAFDVAPSRSPLPQPSPYTIIVQGPVRNQRILWSQGLTLSRAIVTAEYTGRKDPSLICVYRQGERYEIKPASLLRGETDPAIEPGDIIELRP